MMLHLTYFFLCNPILFAICTSTSSKLCKQQHVEGLSVALLKLIVNSELSGLS
jgi:hypothetical protein